MKWYTWRHQKCSWNLLNLLNVLIANLWSQYFSTANCGSFISFWVGMLLSWCSSLKNGYGKWPLPLNLICTLAGNFGHPISQLAKCWTLGQKTPVLAALALDICTPGGDGRMPVAGAAWGPGEAGEWGGPGPVVGEWWGPSPWCHGALGLNSVTQQESCYRQKTTGNAYRVFSEIHLVKHRAK